MIYFDTFSVYPLLQFNQIPTSAAMLPAELAHRALRSEDNEERARRLGGYILLEKMVKKHGDGFKSGVEGIVKPEFGMFFDRRGILPCLRYDSYGKPYFEDHDNVAFNLSHSAHMAACVLSLANEGEVANAVGIDLQATSTTPKRLKLPLMRTMTPIIAVFLPKFGQKKEALLKCIGVGLSCIDQADTEHPEALGCRYVATEERELSYVGADGKECVERYILTVCEQVATDSTPIA